MPAYSPIRFSRTLFVLLVLLYAGLHLRAQTQLAHQLDSLFAAPARRPFSGVVLVMQGNKTLYKKVMGLSDREKGIRIGANDRFYAGSVTKQITATLVLQEVEAGHISLNNTVRSYLPDIPYSWADTVTVHQLLNNTSGLVAFDKPLTIIPGTAFVYSNAGFKLLGDILEKTTGKTYARLTRALFKKCKMPHSLVVGDQKPKHLVKGYTPQANGTIVEEKDVAGSMLPSAGGVITTATDLVNWNRCLHAHRQLLGADMYARMTRASSLRKNHRWGDLGYGYGLQLEENPTPSYSHNGAVSGFVSTLIYFPNSKTSIVLLENQGFGDADMLTVMHFHDAVRTLVKAAVQ